MESVFTYGIQCWQADLDKSGIGAFAVIQIVILKPRLTCSRTKAIQSLMLSLASIIILII